MAIAEETFKSKATLIVIDHDSWHNVRPEVTRLIKLYGGTTTRIDVLAFLNDWSEDMEADLKRFGKSSVTIIAGSGLLNRVAYLARAEITEFVSVLRNRLVTLAFAVGRKKWGDRFSELWWYTQVSQKNSALEDTWWSYFRFKAVCLQIDSKSYSNCMILGDRVLCGLVQQQCLRKRLKCISKPTSRRRWESLKVIARRIYVAIGLLVMVFFVKLKVKPIVKLSQKNEKLILAFSWPEFWKERFGTWEDVYLGQAINASRESSGATCMYALGLYGRFQMRWKEIFQQFKRLRDPRWKSQKIVPLEHYGSVGLILGEYLRISDIFHFSRMVCSSQYRDAFVWQGIDFSKMFFPMLWNSALVLWPYLICQERMVALLIKDIKPDAAACYSFEHLEGKALLKGIRKATKQPVIAMQHGPMSLMKLLYSGTPNEGQPTDNGGMPRPEANVYTVDGSFSKDLLIESGINPDKIKITGAARLDPVWKMAAMSRSCPRFHESKTRVLVAPALHDTQFVVHAVLTALRENPDIMVAVKPHPKISIEHVQQLVNKFSLEKTLCCSVTVKTSENIYRLLDEADILVGTYSSVLVEALVFGVSPIMLVSHRRPDLSPFLGGKREAVLRADHPEDLRTLIEKLAKDHQFRQVYLKLCEGVVSEVLGPVDGKSASRVASVCYEQVAI